MDRREFAIFADALKTYFPREQLLPNKQAMELWYRELQDIPYQVAEVVLRKWVATEKWSPSIAEIRAMATECVNGKPPDWGEGWQQVQRAILRYGRDRKAEAMATFDPLTRKTVEYLGWRELCNSENAMADRANFRDCFKIVLQREQTDQRLPQPLLQAINMLQIKDMDGNPFRLEGGN